MQPRHDWEKNTRCEKRAARFCVRNGTAHLKRQVLEPEPIASDTEDSCLRNLRAQSETQDLVAADCLSVPWGR